MYMRRKPSRAKARSWYSALAACSANALATKVGGSLRVICSTSESSTVFKRTLTGFTKASALICGCTSGCMSASSKPSIEVINFCDCKARHCAGVGGSGLTT